MHRGRGGGCDEGGEEGCTEGGEEGVMREGRRGAQCVMRKGRRGKFTFHAGTCATVLCVQLLQMKAKGAPE